MRLAELAADILPKGVLNVVMGPGRPTGEALIHHPDVDMLALTGSVDTGKHFARTAADTLKRVHLELGGKAPVVVFDDVAWRARWKRSPAPATTTRGRTARPPRVCWPAEGL